MNHLRWIKALMTSDPWHLTYDAHTSLCGLTFSYGLRHHIRAIGLEPPPDHCEECLARQEALDEGVFV